MTEAFDWNNYYSLAKLLVEKNHEIEESREAWLRTAISRFYFGVFCLLRNKAIEEQVFEKSKSSDDHQDLYDVYLTNEEDKVSSKIASNLKHLRRLRNKADYDGYIANIVAESNQARRYASDVMKWFDQINFSIY